MPERLTKAGEPDKRGGGTAMAMPHGGQIGNPPFEPTEEQRAKVRALAKIFPPIKNLMIAVQIHGPNGHHISQRTLERHFRDDMAIGRAELLSSIGAQLIKRALEGPNAEGVKGDPYVQIQIMSRLGGWNGRMEVSGPDGGPIQTVDISNFSADDFMLYGRLAAIAEGIDPDSIIFERLEPAGEVDS